MQEAIISVSNLSKSYGAFSAVKSISFSVYKGEVFSILGPNGAGKTTTLEMIEGLLPIDSGEVTLCGYAIHTHYAAIKNRIGVQLQSNQYFDYLTLGEMIDLFAVCYDSDVDAKAILQQVDLTDKIDRCYNTLSTGQKQRFSLGLTLIHDPDVIFMDEPTAGLDSHARHRLWELIEGFREQQKTIVLTTHFMDEAEILSDRVAIMDSGKIITIDTPENLISQLIASGFKKKIVADTRANLEDVFLQLTGKQLD